MPDFLNELPAIVIPALIFYFCFWRPFMKVRRARSWRATPCIVIDSEVREDQTDSGLYEIVVMYQYEFGGRPYWSSRYNFSIGSTAGKWMKKRVAARLAPGTATTCYVDPDDPAEAVIVRGMTWDMYFMGLFALAIVSVFAFMIYENAW